MSPNDSMSIRSAILLLSLLALGPGAPARANVAPAPIISEGMVLQRGRRVPLWGTAAPGEKIRIDFRDRSYNVSADADGKWLARIDPGAAGGPFVLDFTADNAVEVANVWVGDVWLCSGQSNMVWSVRQSLGAERIGPGHANRRIRMLRVANDGALSGWMPATPESILPFSAVGYYFGREIEATQKVPVGLIQSAVGGTAAELWTPADRLAGLGVQNPPANAGIHYRNMIVPLQPYGIKGTLWYQGESNQRRAAEYQGLFEGMIRIWREAWGQGAFPFLYVQLARIGPAVRPAAPAGPADENVTWPALREAQRKSMRLGGTGMVTIFDVSDGDIHPPDKMAVAARLAVLARSKVYGESGLEPYGPQIDSIRHAGDDLVLQFSHDRGLHSRNGELREFEVRFADGSFRPVRARIEKNRVLIAVGAIAGRYAVRYGWSAHPRGNLYNGAGLPATPFLFEGIRVAEPKSDRPGE